MRNIRITMIMNFMIYQFAFTRTCIMLTSYFNCLKATRLKGFMVLLIQILFALREAKRKLQIAKTVL